MKILVTGANGFVGKNLCAALNNIKDGKDRTRPRLGIDEVYEYDIHSAPSSLIDYCREADFVFNLAGVNRPKEQNEFMEGNFGFASTLLDTLKRQGNRCPVMLSSSQQASLTGRFGNSEYGRSKKAGEDLFLDYEREFLKGHTETTESTEKAAIAEKNICDIRDICVKKEKDTSVCGEPRVLIYRFPNLFGKWCRPNYNSAVATFCYNIAHDLPIQVNDPNVELELLYIDDLVQEMLDALEGREHRCEFDGLDIVAKEQGTYCCCPVTHKVTLGRIVELLHGFAKPRKAPMIPAMPSGSFEKKLYATYLSYLPKEKIALPLTMNVDERGSFTELVHFMNCGQVSVNVCKPGVVKGMHWHNTKWEYFIVVSGHGLIQMRPIHSPFSMEDSGEVIEFEVSGDNIRCIQMLPGYTHNIRNLSDTEDLVTVMYCNEIFDPNHPDTFFDKV